MMPTPESASAILTALAGLHDLACAALLAVVIWHIWPASKS